MSSSIPRTAAFGSSSHHYQQQQQQLYHPTSAEPMTTTNKKKFGKNLNKLTKPPAPPITTEGKSTSRNGLLLLSTKRATSGSTTGSSGLLSKPLSKQPLPSLGLQYESNTSTHDVLLGAVVGASRAEQQPDAWGVAEKKDSNNNDFVSGVGGGGGGTGRLGGGPGVAAGVVPGMGPGVGPGVGPGLVTNVAPGMGPPGVGPLGPPGIGHGVPPGMGHGMGPVPAGFGGVGHGTIPGQGAVPTPGGVAGPGPVLGPGPGSRALPGPSLPPTPPTNGVNIGVGAGYGATGMGLGVGTSLYDESRMMEAENKNPSWDDYGGRGSSSMTMTMTMTAMPGPKTPPAKPSMQSRYELESIPPRVIHSGVPPPKTNGFDNQNGNHLTWGSAPSPTTAEEDEQQAYMARLARERAERRRQEEELRANEQKEKAAQRLRELEQKIAQENTRSNANANMNKSVSSSPVVLEKLGGGSSATKTSSDRPVRTLYDPNRTYSSLLGGRANGVSGSGTTPTTPTGPGNATNVPVAVSNSSVGAASVSASASVGSGSDNGGGSSIGKGNSNGQEESKDKRNNPAAENAAAAVPVIHLSSYEDRDRGERNTSAGPRMLFDPKSGTMVAVPTREEASSARASRKDRKKFQKKEDPPEKKKAKNRNQPARGRSDSTSKNEKKKASLKNERRLPRTCGVLYARDDKGACYCADGCDGDLGYGAHSVPGGRVRNADAYTKFTEKQQQIYRSTEEVVYDDLYGGGETFDSEQNKPENTLQTGFTFPEMEPELEPEVEPETVQVVDWVKPNEKITLITGGDESPTLQATAREWAPSQAALAAAAAADKLKDETSVAISANDTSVTLPGIPSTKDTSVTLPGIPSIGSQDVEDDDDSDDDVPSFMGLGFDPTQNMDAMIQSPSLRATDAPNNLDSVDLGSLSLEPAFGAATNSRHIFAFGTGSTWGSTDAPGNNDWGAPLGSNGKSKLFGATEAFSKEGEDKAATFLSLASSSWGAPTLGGKAADHID